MVCQLGLIPQRYHTNVGVLSCFLSILDLIISCLLRICLNISKTFDPAHYRLFDYLLYFAVFANLQADHPQL